MERGFRNPEPAIISFPFSRQSSTEVRNVNPESRAARIEPSFLGTLRRQPAGILGAAFSTVTKFVYCCDCKAVAEYQKSMLEADGRAGLEIVCSRCHAVICTFFDSKPVEAAEPEKPLACPKCGMPLPCFGEFDSIDGLRCPECDALFERGQFICYGARSAAE